MADLWLVKDLNGTTVAITADRQTTSITIHGKATVFGTDFETLHMIGRSELDTLIAALTEARRAIS